MHICICLSRILLATGRSSPGLPAALAAGLQAACNVISMGGRGVTLLAAHSAEGVLANVVEVVIAATDVAPTHVLLTVGV
jgi:hypothetical protein